MKHLRTPEEDECLHKQAQLAELESKLADDELELASLKAELKAFEDEYKRVVAPCYAEMEELQSEAAAIPKADGDETDFCPSSARETCPPGELKTLFREVAKSIHPDLASSDEERLRRDELMAKANAAYAEGNDAQLRELLLKWKADPQAVQGEDVVAQLIRAIRLIAWVKSRQHEVRREMKEVRKTDLYFLKVRADRAATEGRNLLLETRLKLEQQIVDQRARVREMQSTTPAS